MENYKHLFSLPENIHYINGAYMSPSPKAVSAAGQAAILQKGNPTLLSQEDFFLPAEKVKASYGKLINAPSKQISLIPSASYGFANAFKNCNPKGRKKAICVAGEFPSGYFTMVNWCKEHDLEMQVIRKPKTNVRRGWNWNQAVINAIDKDTALVLVMSTHWMDGTKFDLLSIGEKCGTLNVDLLVDGTQSVGAEEIDVQAANISALINPAYKWLMGPYGFGLAYYAPSFNTGNPIEESWMNRDNAMDFANLTDYSPTYKPGAARYDVGESANFINLAMMQAGLDFLLDFGVKNIREYCQVLTKPLCDFLQNGDYWIEEEAFRSKHLFGFELPSTVDLEQLKLALAERKIYLSFRKNAIRVSPNIYNTEEDIGVLIECLKRINSL